MDGDIQSSVIENIGANVSTNFISCPSDPNQTLGIKMHYLVLLIKYVNFLNLKIAQKKILYFWSSSNWL